MLKTLTYLYYLLKFKMHYQFNIKLLKYKCNRFKLILLKYIVKIVDEIS